MKVLTAIGLASTIATCAYDRDPTGVSDVQGVETVSQRDRGYAEEGRAVELAREIPDLAGFYFDTSGNVIVLLKGVAASPANQSLLRPRFGKELSRGRRRNPAADLIVRGADYSFLELKGWRDQLMNGDILAVPGVVWLDLDEFANRVLIGLDVGADPGAARAIVEGLAIPSRALAFEVTGPYVRQQTLRDEFRPLQGGIQIQRVSGASRVGCTLGFTALRNSQQVFLTAGHCSPNATGTDSVAQFQPVAPLTHAESLTMSPIGREIFQYSAPCGNRRCSYSDAAIYGLIPAQAWGLGRVAQPAIGCFPGPCNPPVLNLGAQPYWVIDTTHESFIVGELVSEIGSATGWSQGSVKQTCVNVTPSSGVQYNCQMFASYGSNDGDSGAPILLDIQGGEDSTVTLGGIHSGRSGKNAVFSPWSGIVQDYGSLAVVFVQEDTSRPPVPESPVLPDDSSRTVASPSGTAERYYRDIVGVMFDDTTSGKTIRAIIKKYQASIIAGGRVFPNPIYYLEVPDPGGTYAAISSIARAISAETGVFGTLIPQWRGRVQIRYRYPNDGPSARRADWLSPTNATRALLAIRAPLAWGCETGTYSNTASVAIIDRQFEAHNDLVVQTIRPPVSPLGFVAIPTVEELEHGNRVAGIFGATGDNSMGIAGVMWRSHLTLYGLGAQGGVSRNPYHDFLLHLVHINDTLGTRIVSMSTTIGNAATDTINIGLVVKALQVYFRNGGILIYAIGNDRHARPTLAQLRTTVDTAFSGLDKAVAILRDSLGFANNIITVGATGTGGGFMDSTTYWRGGTDILAPGEQILTLGVSNTTSIAPYGTSYATPYVAGVAAQLLTMDSTITPAQLKDYIVRGARHPRLNRETGVFGPPQSVAGAPETVYQLDAYGALTLLASERPSIPLCGNRVWVASTQLVAQRDTGAAPQVLADIGDTAAFVNVHHGGRRVDVWTDDFDPLSFVFNQGTWMQSGNPPASPDGGAWNSLWSLSHDGDTAVTVVTHTGAGQDTLEVRRGPTGGSSIHLADVVVPLASSGNYVCIFIDTHGGGVCRDSAFAGTSEFVYSRTAAYSPPGDRVIVSVSTARNQTTSVGGMAACPWDTGPDPQQCRTHIDYSLETIGTTYHQIGLPTGTDTVLATPATAPVVVFWAALAEDGGQLVSGEGVVAQTSTLRPRTNSVGFQQLVTSQSTTACTLRYRLASSGLVPRFASASEDVCRGPLGGGSVAPAPPISSRTR